MNAVTEPHVATLGSEGAYTSFAVGSQVIRFRTPKRLQCYTAVREWDNGYLVVDARYEGDSAPVEEYIDLNPILENLYIDADAFLASVEEVRIDE